MLLGVFGNCDVIRKRKYNRIIWRQICGATPFIHPRVIQELLLLVVGGTWKTYVSMINWLRQEMINGRIEIKFASLLYLVFTETLNPTTRWRGWWLGRTNWSGIRNSVLILIKCLGLLRRAYVMLFSLVDPSSDVSRTRGDRGPAQLAAGWST